MSSIRGWRTCTSRLASCTCSARRCSSRTGFVAATTASTAGSAGYDLASAEDGILTPLERRQFGTGLDMDTPLMDYLTHQRRLLPAIAESYALQAAFDPFAQGTLGKVVITTD